MQNFNLSSNHLLWACNHDQIEYIFAHSIWLLASVLYLLGLLSLIGVSCSRDNMALKTGSRYLKITNLAETICNVLLISPTQWISLIGPFVGKYLKKLKSNSQNYALWGNNSNKIEDTLPTYRVSINLVSKNG